MNRFTTQEAFERAGRVLARARCERDELFAHGRADAVAEAACPNGTPDDKAAIAAHYMELRDKARQRRNDMQE
jgi:hypothetical protein